MITTWGLSRIQGSRPSCGAVTTSHEREPGREIAHARTFYRSKLPSPKMARALAALTSSDVCIFYKITSCGPDIHRAISVIGSLVPLDIKHVSRLACSYPREGYHMLKRQYQTLLESWLPYIKKIGLGSPVWVLRQEWSSCTHSVYWVNNLLRLLGILVQQWLRNLFFFFFMLFPPC